MSKTGYLEDFLYNKAAQNVVPISGTFELLPVCNLNCKMCYVKQDMRAVNDEGGLHTADEWLTLGKKAVKAGMLFLLLTGGETFLFPELEKLYTELHKLGLSIDINTNGTLITENEIDWLKKNLPRHIKISLYGATEDSYQNLCGNSNAFHRVLNSFELLKKAGITVYSSITVTPSNYSELVEMFRICDYYDIPVKTTSYMFPPLRSLNRNLPYEYRLSPELAAEATFKIAKRENTEEAFAERAKLYSEDRYQNYLSYISNCNECGYTTCRAGKCTFWITWKGDMIPCAMIDFLKYPVMGTNDFNEAWKKTTEIVRNIRTAPECRDCLVKDSCYSCAASSFCETGDTKKRSKYVCQMTSEYLRLMKQFYLTTKKPSE